MIQHPWMNDLADVTELGFPFKTDSPKKNLRSSTALMPNLQSASFERTKTSMATHQKLRAQRRNRLPHEGKRRSINRPENINQLLS